jgi:hypothetical protein
MKEIKEMIAKALRNIQAEYGNISNSVIIITGDDMLIDVDKLLGINLIYCPTITGFHLAHSGLSWKACREFEDACNKGVNDEH